MGALQDVLAYIDNLKRVARRNLSDAVNNPEDTAALIRERQKEQWAKPDAGMDLVGGPLGKVGAAFAGTFIGPKSRLWDHLAAKKAEEMLSSGVDPRVVWKETGTWKSPEGVLKQEVDDSSAELLLNLTKMKKHPEGASFSERLRPDFEDFPIGAVYRNNELYAAYPEILRAVRLKEGRVLPDWMPKGVESGAIRSYGGHKWSPLTGELSLTSRPSTPHEEIVGRTGHEMQHFVNYMEDWQPGGSESLLPRSLVQIMLDRGTPVDSAAFEAYRRLMGEAEARATAARTRLSKGERREVFPEDSYDVPIDELLRK